MDFEKNNQSDESLKENVNLNNENSKLEEFAIGLPDKIKNLVSNLAKYIEELDNKDTSTVIIVKKFLEYLDSNPFFDELSRMKTRRGYWKAEKDFLQSKFFKSENLLSSIQDYEKIVVQTQSQIDMFSAQLLLEPNNKNIKWLMEETQAYFDGFSSDLNLLKDELKRRGLQVPDTAESIINKIN